MENKYSDYELKTNLCKLRNDFEEMGGHKFDVDLFNKCIEEVEQRCNPSEEKSEV